LENKIYRIAEDFRKIRELFDFHQYRTELAKTNEKIKLILGLREKEKEGESECKQNTTEK